MVDIIKFKVEHIGFIKVAQIIKIIIDLIKKAIIRLDFQFNNFMVKIIIKIKVIIGMNFELPKVNHIEWSMELNYCNWSS